MASIISGSDNFNTNDNATQTELEFLTGSDRTWQDVTASRSAGVTYTNNTGRDICVVVTVEDITSASGGEY